MYQLLYESPYTGRDFYNFESTSQLPRHRWYYLKEGFSSSLVEEAIRHVGSQRRCKQLRLLEPFSGTGTTALTAALLGHHCLAIEVNPFLAFVSDVKLIQGKWRRKNYLERLQKIIKDSAKGSYSHLENFSTFSEQPGKSKWLFNRSVLRQFAGLSDAIQKHGGTYKDAFKLSAIVAAYECCNAKRDGKALRYKANWQERAYSGKDIIREFRQHAWLLIDDLQHHPIDRKIDFTIINGDTRMEIVQLEDEKYDLVVTSPPYLNSFDYSDIYRPELFLGGYVHSNEELYELRLKTVRSHIQANWSREVSYESQLLSPIVEQLDRVEKLWDQRIPLMIQAYFDDMSRVLCALISKLKVGAEVWLVVSTSAYAGVHIPADLIIADAATNAGFRLVGIHCLRHLRAAGQQWRKLNSKTLPLRESLIILSKQ